MEHSSENIVSETPDRYALATRIVHLGLAVIGIAAYLTAELVEDSGDLGYLLHAYLGLATFAFVLLRMLAGVVGPEEARFAHWALFSSEQRACVRRELAGLLRLRIPDGELHQGIAGIVQAFGLALFAWMAITGTVLFVVGDGDGFARAVEDAHEIGEGLIPVFLALHVGAVLVHLLSGPALVSRMFGFGPAAKR